MTVHELTELLKGFEPNATVMRQTSDWACCYKLEDVATYDDDYQIVFLEFDDQDDCGNEDDCNSKDLNNKNTTTKGGFNRGFLKEAIIQCCEDIKNSVDEIVDDIDKLNNLDITISCTDNECPVICVYKGYDKFITINDKMKMALLNE